MIKHIKQDLPKKGTIKKGQIDNDAFFALVATTILNSTSQIGSFSLQVGTSINKSLDHPARLS